MAKKTLQAKSTHHATRQLSPSVAEARRLISVIEKSQIPFGESAPIFARIKSDVEAGKELNTEDYEHLLGLVKKAREWEKGVESSAQTQPEETLPG